MVRQDPDPTRQDEAPRACAEGLSSSVFSKALYMGVLQAMELEGWADSIWLLTRAEGFSETLQTYDQHLLFIITFSPPKTMSLDGPFCIC